jgi:hypothetical protein
MVGNADGGQLVNYLQSLGSYLASPIIACYGAAVLWKRTTEPVSAQEQLDDRSHLLKHYFLRSDVELIAPGKFRK